MPEPPIFATVDAAATLARLIAYYEAQPGAQALQPASAEMLMLKAAAYEITLVYSALQYSGEQNLVDFSNAPALDYLGALLDTARLPASAATTTIQFTLDGSHTGTTIPLGTRVASVNGQIIFETLEDLAVLATVTTGSVTAEAQALGTIGNAYAIGAITTILDPVALVTAATNSVATSGGAEIETDEAFRNRIKLAPSRFSTAGSKNSYKWHALTANAGIIDVAVVTPAGGDIIIYPLMADGTTTPAAVLAQVDAIVSGETVRPLTDSVTVSAPTAVAYNIDIDLTIYTSADSDDVEAAVTAAMQALALSKRQTLGQDIGLTQIIAAAHAASSGIFNSVINSPAADVVIGVNDYGNIGTITVTISGTTTG